MNNEIMVTIPLDDYTSLVEERKEYWLLIDAIFSRCKLDYRKTNLVFSYVEDVMQTLLPSNYENKLKQLKEEYEEQRRTELAETICCECEVDE